MPQIIIHRKKTYLKKNIKKKLAKVTNNILKLPIKSFFIKFEPKDTR